MRAFPQVTMHEALYKLPMIQGIALRTAAAVMDPMNEADMVNGYIRQSAKQRAVEILATNE
jgi:hypothetical protein